MPGQNLTREEARTRAELLSVSSYEVELDIVEALDPDRATFPVSARVRFSCERPGESTFIDFIGESVDRIVLNGAELSPTEHYADSRVQLPDLAAENELLIQAHGRYMNTGEGLHRFLDPVDNETYLYTQFEVADSRRMFPVFEQPDLKSHFTFAVSAPARWAVISNQPGAQPSPADTREVAGTQVEVARWEFAPTPLISCYLTALLAGPYASVEDSVTLGDGRTVPLGLYCRSSLLPHLDAENIFDCTKKGFAFFEKEFGLPYPFEKYDQIFTPEYNSGAMENVGAVTFNEMYVFRAKVTEAIIERRALTILHELAHMWFGNLVTMRWWDDLWLNESFAEWASNTALAEATQWTQAWTTFATSEKSWAYQQDQLSSTHPIAADMRDLEDVEVNFDGITYAKGASVLAQLVAYVGREAFTAGLRAYFVRHAWKNTTLDDLLTELEATSGRELRSWSKAWLETAGVTTLSAHIETGRDGLISAASIDQSATPEHPTLRPHRLAVGCYDLIDGLLHRRQRIEMDVQGASTPVPDLIGQPRPDLLLVNDDDLAYAKIALDEQSLHSVTQHARTLPSLARSLVLGAAWESTRDAQMSARDFIALSLGVLDADLDSTLRRHLLGRIATALHQYTAPEARAKTHAAISGRLKELALHCEPGSDAQLQFVSAFASYARTPEDTSLIQAWFEGQTPPGLALDTEMRWTLLTSLVTAAVAGEAEIVAELERDGTATGRERAARARAAVPTLESKENAFISAVERDNLPNQTLDAVAEGFQRVHDLDLLAPFVQRYHDALISVWSGRTHAIAESVVEQFYPSALAGPELLQQTQAWLDAHPDAPAGLRRLVAENRDGVARACRAQSRDGQG
ncbi:aminopeptidase N [Gephyromycinifex aptenodytis]|uniref:aminopeptidase N n=1 Tax=Gephyromycinifex aptenodytis TaxID=2716227 RepID=UPI001445A215|nr:aminopeptidase N [Gephyromycinifex aptenodytis]